MVCFLIKLQSGVLQLYLNETLAQVLSCEFFLLSQNTYLQIICERLFLLLFLKFYFYLCEESEDNEDQRFCDYVDGNHVNKNIAKFHVM